MKKMKIKPLMITIFVLIWFVLRIMPIFVNPERWPQPLLQIYLLRLTPIGTHIDDVIEILEQHDSWGIWYVTYERGFIHPSQLGRRLEDGSAIIGDMSIRVFAGRYWPSNIPILGFITETAVSIFWAFDEEGRLIETYIWKTTI